MLKIRLQIVQPKVFGYIIFNQVNLHLENGINFNFNHKYEEIIFTTQSWSYCKPLERANFKAYFNCEVCYKYILKVPSDVKL